MTEYTCDGALSNRALFWNLCIPDLSGPRRKPKYCILSRQKAWIENNAENETKTIAEKGVDMNSSLFLGDSGSSLNGNAGKEVSRHMYFYQMNKSHLYSRRARIITSKYDINVLTWLSCWLFNFRVNSFSIFGHSSYVCCVCACVTQRQSTIKCSLLSTTKMGSAEWRIPSSMK